MHFDLLDQRPDPRISGDLGDRSMKQLVRLVEGLAVFGRVGLALAFQDRMQAEDLAGGRALGGELRSGRLERFADDDGLRQGGDRNARDEDSRLGKYLQQALVR